MMTIAAVSLFYIYIYIEVRTPLSLSLSLSFRLLPSPVSLLFLLVVAVFVVAVLLSPPFPTRKHTDIFEDFIASQELSAIASLLRSETLKEEGEP